MISEPKRNLVTAMAVHELAVSLTRSDAQARLADAALELMQEAVDDMKSPG